MKRELKVLRKVNYLKIIIPLCILDIIFRKPQGLFSAEIIGVFIFCMVTSSFSVPLFIIHKKLLFGFR